MSKPGRPPDANPRVVGDAAAAQPGTVGSDAGGTAAPSGPSGGDWLGEITERPQPSPADGTPVATRGRSDRSRGQARESKRGQGHGG